MRKSIYALAVLITIILVASCNNYETYGDKKDKERNAISQFIADSSINVISETLFHNQGDSTSVTKNEFVYFESSGIYMQIVNRGCGDEIKDGERLTLLCRYSEFDILNDTLQTWNNTNPLAAWLDKMVVTRTTNTYTATFISGMMYQTYSASVPTGWLVPLSYVRVGRPTKANDEVSKVRLIVPHTQGHSYAIQYVYPYYYEITFEREL